MRDLWYKDAVVYCLDVDRFQDSNGDGVGDFNGLKDRLTYISGLGFTAVWLLPFYPTPDRDNGYDVKDYYSVDPTLGTLGDFVEFIHLARERGLRVIVDLVVNHTSRDHPWFQAARSDPRSPYRDYYVWSKTKPEDAHEGVIFPGVQDTIWSYDRKAGEYYLHRFYPHQPDLNVGNPRVREEIERIMGFWLALGVSGFRIDAAPFVVELKGVDREDVRDPLEFLADFRSFLSWRRGDAIMLAEANLAPEEMLDYFSDDKLQMGFNFILNQHLFLALARQQASPLIEGLLMPPPMPENSQWATFLRNHDELDLGRLSESQRQDTFAAFAPEPSMQLYDRGIRRRLAPMLEGHPQRLKMAYALMLSMPGTPVVNYGEEIGMGDDLSLKERDAVRTPMQWSADDNAGFSAARPRDLIAPVVSKGPFDYRTVNVARQRKEPDSLLNWMERAIRVRKENPEFGWGKVDIVDTGDPRVFGHRLEHEGGVILAVHNLADKGVRVSLDVSEYAGRRLLGLIDHSEREPVRDQRHELDIEPYGFHWFRVR
ncbi:MAG TPA: alpha-amylase family protein [Candidatus Limnocylindrales bacterium]|nr:alpha-amylase family protein [Candidatus Limnocylindrales bacterium]